MTYRCIWLVAVANRVVGGTHSSAAPSRVALRLFKHKQSETSIFSDMTPSTVRTGLGGAEEAGGTVRTDLGGAEEAGGLGGAEEAG